jgi:uncharacterized protein with NAD-binding domain and iron-sulfur cluster
MSAAHELIERGYQVEIYERNVNYVGGKARSVKYLGDPQNPYKVALPGEHGFRFFPGFYKHVIDTMSRIPYVSSTGKKGTVFDNLNHTSRIMIARYGKPPIVTIASFPKHLSDLELIIKDLHGGIDSGLTQEEIKFFAERIWQLATSCTRRKNNDYERLGWWEYLEADRFAGKNPDTSPYVNLLVKGLTRTLVAARAETASTKTGGNVFLQLFYGMANPAVNTDRVLDGPTNDRWLNAWKEYLISKGVKFTLGAIVSTGDYYIMAVPVEQAAKLMSPALTKADPTLKYIIDLAPSVNWMNGIQFYLTEQADINNGHVIYSDSQWALTSISQIQFWDDYDITTKGNGNVKGLLSVDISDWSSPGKFTTTKQADHCTRKEVADEVWAQLKNSLNIDGVEILRDDMRIDWFLDRDIEEKSIFDAKENLLSDREPLLVNNTNTWGMRPNTACDIPNLFIASDYVRTFTDLATMEGANEAARRAVNCLLDKDKNSASKCKIWKLHDPLIFSPLRWYDEKRWNKGLPWTIHLPWWLKIFMIAWVPISLGIGFVQLVLNKIINLFK